MGKNESTVDKKVGEFMKAIKARANETLKSLFEKSTFYGRVRVLVVSITWVEILQKFVYLLLVIHILIP